MKRRTKIQILMVFSVLLTFFIFFIYALKYGTSGGITVIFCPGLFLFTILAFQTAGDAGTRMRGEVDYTLDTFYISFAFFCSYLVPMLGLVVFYFTKISAFWVKSQKIVGYQCGFMLIFFILCFFLTYLFKPLEEDEDFEDELSFFASYSNTYSNKKGSRSKAKKNKNQGVLK